MSKGGKMSRFPHDAKVYVGDLGNNASKQEIEDAFGYYGPLRNVWVARNPPGFAFVEFEDARDAEDAVRGLDGRTICGRRARVELSTGKSSRGYRGPPRRGGRFHPDDRCYECGDRGHYARDCSRYGRRGRRRSRSRSRSRRSSREFRTRSRSYSRSRSRDRTDRDRDRERDRRSRSKSGKRSYSRDSKSKSKTPKRSDSRGDSKSKSKSHSRSRSRDRSRSHSRENGDD